jgi:hypothetical protein
MRIGVDTRPSPLYEQEHRHHVPSMSVRAAADSAANHWLAVYTQADKPMPRLHITGLNKSPSGRLNVYSKNLLNAPYWNTAILPIRAERMAIHDHSGR